MDPSAEPVYRIDRNDRICHLNQDWQDFAAGNGGQALTGEQLLGVSLYDSIAGEQTRHLYQLLIQKVREQDVEVRVRIRCDAPSLRRWLTVRMDPFEHQGVEFRISVDRTEAREPVALLDPGAPRGEGVLCICAWCKKVEVEQRWLEIEQAVQELGLFERQDLPELTHGCCASCYQRVMGEVEAGNADSD